MFVCMYAGLILIVKTVGKLPGALLNWGNGMQKSASATLGLHVPLLVI